MTRFVPFLINLAWNTVNSFNLQSFSTCNLFSAEENFFLFLTSPSKIIICILGFLDLSSKSFNITFMTSHSNSWYFLSFEVISFEQSSKKRAVEMCSSCHLPSIISNEIKCYLITQVENKNASKCSKNNDLN